MKHNKQKEVTAASFNRVAKAIRQKVKPALPYKTGPLFISARALAKILENEAKLLRSMR